MWLNVLMEQPRNSRISKDRWDMDRVRFHMSQPASPKREAKHVSDVLKDVVEGFEQPTQENVLLLREVWSQLVGEQIAKHSSPGFISDFTLTVFVNHPGWLPELERIKRSLLMKLGSKYPELRVHRLRLKLDT